MEKSPEEMLEEVRYIKKWIAEDNETLTKAIAKVGYDAKKLEVELFGKELTTDEKKQIVEDKMIEVLTREFNSENTNLQDDY
jgi:hypothetical protein